METIGRSRQICFVELDKVGKISMLWIVLLPDRFLSNYREQSQDFFDKNHEICKKQGESLLSIWVETFYTCTDRTDIGLQIEFNDLSVSNRDECQNDILR